MIRISHAIQESEVAKTRDLFLEYASSLEVDLTYQHFDSEVADLPSAYGPPQGRLLLADVDGQPAGCVGIRRLTDDICEMKRLYVRTAFQGSGIGRQLVLAAVDAARDLGYRELWLDTLPTMTSAQRLYEQLGLERIDAYGSAHAPGTRFYGLRLGP